MLRWWLVVTGWAAADEASGERPPVEVSPALSVVEVHHERAPGPPATSCQQDLAAAPASVQWPPRKTTSGARRGSSAPKVRRLRWGGSVQPASEHPAARPDELPPVALEGPDEVRARLASVWARADAGQPVRISVFGASHTEGDWWTGHLRRQLQDRWGDRGHGFVFPAPPVAGYRGHDVNLCATAGWQGDWVGKKDSLGDGLLGFMGVSVRASDPGAFGWIETTRDNPHGRQVARIDVYALEGPNQGALDLRLDGQEPRRVDLTASSLGLRRVRLSMPEGAHRLQVGPAGTGEVRLFGASMEREGSGVIVDAMGMRGRTARSWLGWSEPLVRAGLRALAPDVVVWAYGTNEAADTAYDMVTYRADLRASLARLRASIPEPVPCVLVGPTDRVTRGADGVYEPWARTAEVAAVQREVAGDFGCLFWDWQQAMGGPGSMLAWYEHSPKMGAGDLIHLRAAGYAWSAERFLAALDEAAGREAAP